MPPPRRNKEIPGKERSVLSKAKRRGDAVEFSEDVFSQWVLGVRKRKAERVRVGHKEAADLIKAEKSQERKEHNQRVRDLVKQHFGEVTVDRDGRVIVNDKDNHEYMDSDDEFEAQQAAEVAKKEKRANLRAIEANMKNLPKWAQAKQTKVLELQKDDSVVKEQNESFIKAQFSFNKDNSVGEIVDEADKNKLLKNLKRESISQKKKELSTSQMPTVMNFENDDSVVVVETSNLDQVNLSSAIISRRAQRELIEQQKATSIDTTRMGRRAAAFQSRQAHTMIDSDDSSEEESGPKKIIKLVKKSSQKQQPQQQKNQKQKQKGKAQPPSDSDDAEGPSEMQLLQARFANRSLKKPKKGPAPKAPNRKERAARQKILHRYGATQEESDNEFDYDSTSEEEQQYEEVFVEETDDEEEEEEEGEEDEDEQAGEEDEGEEDRFPNQPESENDDYIVEEGDELGFDDEEFEEEGDYAEEDEDEWDVVEEQVIEPSDDEEAADEDIVSAKLDKAQKKKIEKEQLAAKALEEEKAAKAAEKKAKTEEITQPTKRQKTNKIEQEFSRDKELAASIASELINNEFSIDQAVAVPMHSASAWFSLPKPKVWDQETERKQRLQAQLNRQAAIDDGTWDYEAERNRKRKLTPIEAMEYDPTYGWEEGDGSNNRDLSEIFGIPAASMGGRYRKKPLSDKNKKNSSDSRKAKKAEKQREKDMHAQMAFEAGFADQNTAGRSVKWDDSSDDDNGKEYRGGAKFKEPKNRKDRRKLEEKKKNRVESAHKRGKMISGKYYFGQKDSAVNF